MCKVERYFESFLTSRWDAKKFFPWATRRLPVNLQRKFTKALSKKVLFVIVVLFVSSLLLFV
jgi:hypothetical protein